MNDILKNLTVLFVEDEEKIRTSMASVMEDVFKKVIVAGNGDEGLKKFKKYLYSFKNLLYNYNVSNKIWSEYNGKNQTYDRRRGI